MNAKRPEVESKPPKDNDLPAPPDSGEELHEEEADDAVIGRAFRWSAAAIVGLALIVGSAAYLLSRPKPTEVTEQKSITLPEIRDTSEAKIPVTPFRDVTKSAGIDFVHVNGAYGAKLLPETMGGGCAIFDYDNDGDQDILLVNSNYWPWDKRAEKDSAAPATMALYQNDGRMQFTDVTKQAGLDFSIYGMGCAVGDYDDDGNVDLYLTAVGKNRLLRNVGGRFEDVTEAMGVAGDEKDWGSSCGWFDYDNDGRLDLIVCNYLQWSREYDESQNFRLGGGERAYGPPKDFRGAFLRLYHNAGERFEDVSEKAGVRIVNEALKEPAGKSLGVVPIDLDQDGWMDLIIANDTVRNFLLKNQGNGTFREIGGSSGIGYDPEGQESGAMGADVCEFRNDGVLAIAIGNFANEMTSFYVATNNPLQFVDQSVVTGLGPPTRVEVTFGLFFFDYDLDGREDMLSANGHLEEDIHKVQQQSYEQPPQLFWNTGGAGSSYYVKTPPDRCGPDFAKPMVGRGAAFGDLDGDGDLDVLITATGRAPRLLRNDQQLGHHWLRVRLVNKGRNRDALGAVLEAHIGDQVLRRRVMPTRSYLSQCELPVTFGLGKHERIDKLVIRWPDGAREEVAGAKLPVDQLHVLRREVDVKKKSAEASRK